MISCFGALEWQELCEHALSVWSFVKLVNGTIKK